ncbi:hypothetical protein V6U81_05415 [Micromonospora sp. CPCC 205711]|uniref:hypothetical protein n=1 Tax=Micromonospora sp. CPCC 205547 TaxID=3122400 RepID=UPI002FF1C280
MSYRRRDARPRVALWMLVALGDVVLLMVSAGLPAMVALLAVATMVAAGVAAWKLSRRDALAGKDAVPVPVVARRRA